ncbi:hypothetical protein FACS1894111_08430 [Clostridia bacterium]|nr:hypothetical protein FACS1894111_08430 [Clostridia bacterium]
MNTHDYWCIHQIDIYCEEIMASIRRFGNSYDVFLEDRDYYKSVSKSIEEIGELAKSFSSDYRKKTEGEIPWKNIIGMRDVFAHSYGNMDEYQIWKTATENIPVLFDFCEKEIRKYRSQEGGTV